MGQYWVPVNLTKKEFINPHKLGSGLKLWEQLANHPGVGSALVILLAAMPEQRGGGDFSITTHSKKVVGRWAGDQIALVGDYAEDGDLAPEHKASKIWEGAMREADERKEGVTDYTDITEMVCKVIEEELGGKYVGDGWRDFQYAEEKRR